MSLNASEIAALAAELSPLVGARVDGVRVPAERTVILELHGPAGSASLLLSAEADLTRLHATARRPPPPSVPFALQALLRRELEGARLSALDPRPGDRVVELRFERLSGPRTLVAELTGRHGNLLLLDAERIIRAAAGRNLSSRRRLVPGEAYELPAARAGDAEERIRFAPVPDAGPFPLSAAVDAHYARKEEERLLLEQRRRLREPVRASAARFRRALDKLAEEAARVPAAEGDRCTADLLKANLHLVKRGTRLAMLTEYTEEGPREVEVALDPALTPRDNMERAYRRYRRIVESAARVAERQAQVQERLSALDALAAEIDGAANAELPRLEREARRLGAGPRAAQSLSKKKRQEPALPYRLFRTVAGGAILVGRGAADNDALTFRVARGNDLWLHARGITGAHVLVRLEKGAGPDQETLLDAAHLAAHFSDARGEPSTEVAYTHVKYVRKPRGGAPGAVTYSQERTLLLRIEPVRLERLLASEESAQEP